MHGQKKRRKRSLEGVVTIEDVALTWQLVSEPQWTTEDGYRGARFSVQAEDGRHRELLLEYPMPEKKTGNGSLQLPQRPAISEKRIAEDIRLAISSGWDPGSRGKQYVFRVPEVQEEMPARVRHVAL
jgi:hypothetical protein